MTTQPKLAVNPLLVLGVGIFAISCASIFIRQAQREAPSLTIVTWRLIFAILIMSPFVLSTKRAELRSLGKKDYVWAMLSGVFLGIHFATWISSLAYTSVASSVTFVSSAPIFVAIFAPIFLGEKLTKLLVIGILICFVGGVVMAASDACYVAGSWDCPSLATLTQGQAIYGDMLALTGAITSAFYMLIGRTLRPKMSLWTYIYLVYGAAAGLIVIVALVVQTPMWGYSWQTYGYILLLAVVSQLIGHTTINWALNYLPATYVSLTVQAEPVGATLLAILILGEFPTWIQVCGALLILVGIAIASIRNKSGSA